MIAAVCVLGCGGDYGQRERLRLQSPSPRLGSGEIARTGRSLPAGFSCRTRQRSSAATTPKTENSHHRRRSAADPSPRRPPPRETCIAAWAGWWISCVPILRHFSGSWKHALAWPNPCWGRSRPCAFACGPFPRLRRRTPALFLALFFGIGTTCSGKCTFFTAAANGK